MKVTKYYAVIPRIDIDGLTPYEASRIELALCKLDVVNMQSGTENWMSHYAFTNRFTGEAIATIMINEDKITSLKHQSMADSYICLREWNKELDKLTKELIDMIEEGEEES